MTPSEFERAIEEEVGEPLRAIREMPISERRRRTERKFGRPLKIVSLYDFIGRGSVLRDRTLSHDQVESRLRRALRR